uniref:17-beta-hydroxysteroid dehydrogenase type 6 n=1 Tax=Acrobeloides nanus TaxID=290746 RepID=A0A914D703_9BILA
IMVLYVAILAIALYYLLRYLWEKIPVKNLRNRAVFITGCDSGFGRLLALKCSKNGIPVFAGCYTAEGRQSLEEEAKSYSGKLVAVPLDITNDESVVKAAKFVKENLQLGHKLWALVNNAGAFSIYGPDAWTSIEQYKQAFEVNCLGMIRCTHAFLKLLKESQGRIISVSSVAGRTSFPCTAPYSVAKYGVEAYMDAIRQELKAYGIKCSILEPGIFKTPLINKQAMEARVKHVWANVSDEMKEEYGEGYKDDCKKYLFCVQIKRNPLPFQFFFGALT